MRRSNFDANLAKRRALNDADASGEVADSMEVRMDLLCRMKAGEFGPGQVGLEEMQRRLATIKRAAKRNGLKTRSQVWRES